MAGTMLLPALTASPAPSPLKRTAADQVVLGKSGVRVSRLGFGTGSNGGSVQRKLGQGGFTRLLRYAFDHGITYIDTADMYETHGLVREAIKNYSPVMRLSV